MEHNPFAPPKAAVADPVAPPTQSEIASRLRRFLNLLIDTAGYVVLAVIVGGVIAVIYPPFLANESTLQSYLFAIGVNLLYYLPSEAVFGRTLGKLVTRTQVVSMSGEPPTFWQIVGRTFARLIPLESFTFLQRSGVGAHDSMSRTRVVLTKRD
jgi:uncharacterized RDD family membrane protein YckC